MTKTFEIEDGELAALHEDGRVVRSPIPAGVDKDTFRNALVVIDTLFRQDGIFPTVDEMVKYWPKISKKTYSKILTLPETEKALEIRGISIDGNAGLTQEQSMAIAILSDPTDARLTSTKMRAIGVSMQKYHAWMRNDHFKNTLAHRAEQNLGDGVQLALNRLVGNVEKGDQRAIEKLLEISGRYNPQQIEVQNARQVVLVLVESILKHVTDPDTKNAILGDVEGAMQKLSVMQNLKEIE